MEILKTKLDAYISDYIIKLNEVGIKTVWSCSGLLEDHVEKKYITRPYLVIKFDSLSLDDLRQIAVFASTKLFTAGEIYGESIYYVNLNLNDSRMSTKENVDYSFNMCKWDANLSMCAEDISNYHSDHKESIQDRFPCLIIRMSEYIDSYSSEVGYDKIGREQSIKDSQDQLYEFLIGLRGDNGG